MRLLVGDTRSRKLLRAIVTRDRDRSLRVGQLVQRGALAGWLRARARGERGWLWSYDNGAFEDWKQGRAFDADAFGRDIEAIDRLARRDKPAWLVLPDVVADGARSRDLSLGWLAALRGLGVPLLFALQEGIDPASLSAAEQLRVDGWFIGGATWAWKCEAARQAVAWCRDSRNPARGDHFVHVGRAGSASRIARCRELGVESVDSNGPLWSAEAWRRAIGALSGPEQIPLWGPPQHGYRGDP